MTAIRLVPINDFEPYAIINAPVTSKGYNTKKKQSFNRWIERLKNNTDIATSFVRLDDAYNDYKDFTATIDSNCPFLTNSSFKKYLSHYYQIPYKAQYTDSTIANYLQEETPEQKQLSMQSRYDYYLIWCKNNGEKPKSSTYFRSHIN